MELIFNRAISKTFSYRKFWFVFPVLMLCGLLIVLCRSLSFEAHRWVVLSLGFLPVFLCAGIFLALGVILSRMYSQEVRGQTAEIKTIFRQSLEILIGVAYLSLPLILCYACLWAVMGIFYLLKAIPLIGSTMSVLLSFGPFLLVCGSLALSLLTLGMLFFVTPYLALKKEIGFEIAKELLSHVTSNPYKNITLLFAGLLPAIFVVSFLSIAAILTGSNYTVPPDVLSVSMQWFFIMIPFTAIMTPTVVFFFNFATESFVLVRKSAMKSEKEQEACASQS